MDNVLLKFILSVSGFTWIMIDSKIMRPVRESVTRQKQKFTLLYQNDGVSKNKLKIFKFLDEMLDCAGCFGFWASILFYPLLFTIEPVNYFITVMIGTISSNILISLLKFLRN